MNKQFNNDLNFIPKGTVTDPKMHLIPKKHNNRWCLYHKKISQKLKLKVDNVTLEKKFKRRKALFTI